MILLENEVKLDALTDVQLTNWRILQEYSSVGGSYKNSIFLEKISSVEVHYKSKPLYLILGVIVFIYGIWAFHEEDGLSVLCLFISASLVVAYFLTRKHVVSITPDGGSRINIVVKGADESHIERFITNIQEAKLAKTTSE